MKRQLNRLVVLVVALISGCAASVPLARIDEDRIAKSASPPEGKAALFIQREDAFIARPIPFSVLLDGRLVGDLAPGTFFRLNILPGQHVLSAATAFRTTTIPILCEPAQVYYIQIRPDLWDGHPTPREISNDEGRSLVQQSQLARAVTPQVRNKPSPSSGTAWVTTSGYVITANHLIEGHEKIVLRPANGPVIQTRVVNRDRANDIAVLRAADGSELPPGLPIAHATARLGATVLTVGFPQPEVMGVAPKMTIGNVSALSGVGR
ncbi:MAG: trypsin-like peptidase domain-containing protein [Candidatus Binatia bacterium]